MEGMPLEDMLQSAMLRVDTLVSGLAAQGLSILRAPRVETRATQVAHIGMAAVTGAAAAATGEAVIGEAVTGIRRMDILGLVITAWAMAIHTTGIIRGDTILTVTVTGRT